MDRAATGTARPITWWLYLVTGAAWFIIAWTVLRFDLRSVAAISVLAGIVILTAGLAELFTAFIAPSWRWLHAILGAVFVVTGIVAFFRPGGTFAMLAAFVGWYLLFKGMLDIVLAFATKDVNDAWWLGLVMGVVEVGLGFWAAGSFGRSAGLLIVFVGAIALTRGITDIVLAFRLRSLSRELTQEPAAHRQPTTHRPAANWPAANRPGANRPGATAAAANVQDVNWDAFAHGTSTYKIYADSPGGGISR